jgi:hypothetical protein
VEVDLWYSWFIEVTLQKAGVHHSYGPEKYWVKMNVKHRPEENGDSVHESDSHTLEREVESELEKRQLRSSFLSWRLVGHLTMLYSNKMCL